jgi:hypothetical protein
MKVEYDRVLDNDEKQKKIEFNYQAFLYMPWYIEMSWKNGLQTKRPNYSWMSYFLKLGCSLQLAREKLPKWNPLRIWGDWIELCITLLSARAIPRLRTTSPIRVLPAELIRRMKGFLFEPFPDQPNPSLVLLCTNCKVHPRASLNKFCELCSRNVECYIRTHVWCQECHRCHTCIGLPLICVNCNLCGDCSGNMVCKRCYKCLDCLSPTKIFIPTSICDDCLASANSN